MKRRPEVKINSSSADPDFHFLLLSCPSFSCSAFSSLFNAFLLLFFLALLLSQIKLLLFLAVFVCWVLRLQVQYSHITIPQPTITITEPMAILENEKRSRGLRVPSLSSIKAFGKKSSDAPQQQQQRQQKMDSLSETIPENELPPLPTLAQPQPQPQPQFQAPSPMAAPAPVRAPTTAAPFSLDAAPMGDMLSDRYPMPTPPASSNRNANSDGNGNGNGNDYYYPGSLTVPPIQRTPSNASSYTEPLEDYIPDPEPVDRDSDTVSPAILDEEGEEVDTWTPPEADTAAPLTKLHFGCYQEHRSMPIAANVWHAVPCMTCHKSDREIRHRCVFCCLRICEDCYQGLQKCPRRSLNDLLDIIQT